MKKNATYFISFFCFLSFYNLQAQSWVPLGMPGISAYQWEAASIAIDSNATPYIIYLDSMYDGRATVKKFAAGRWVLIGAPGFTSEGTSDPHIAIDPSGTPYVAYANCTYHCQPTVMKYTTDWIDVGDRYMEPCSANYLSFAIDHNAIPYIGFATGSASTSGPAAMLKFNGTWVGGGLSHCDTVSYTTIALDKYNVGYLCYEHNSRPTVLKDNGVSLEIVGTEGFSPDHGDNPVLAIDTVNNMPYVVFSDYTQGFRSTVMKYDGAAWTNVGDPGFSAGLAYKPSITIDCYGTPYVVYMDDSIGRKATVMKFDGHSWVTVGNRGFSEGMAAYPSIVTDKHGTPYVVYIDITNRYIPTVMKYGYPDTTNETKNISESFSVSLFPNPSPDVVHIRNIQTATTYRLIAFYGKLEQQGTFMPGDNTISLASLNDGIYLLELTDQNKGKIVQKVIKIGVSK